MIPGAHAVHSASYVRQLTEKLEREKTDAALLRGDVRHLVEELEKQQAESAALSAECEQLRADVAKWRSAAAESGRRATALSEELADGRALLSEVLDDLRPPARAPEDIRAWDVTVHVTAGQFARWMELGRVAAL